MELNEYNPKTLKVLAYFVMITGPILFLFGLLLLIYYPILGLFCGCFSVFAIVQSNKWRKIANERINKPTITTYNHANSQCKNNKFDKKCDFVTNERFEFPDRDNRGKLLLKIYNMSVSGMIGDKNTIAQQRLKTINIGEEMILHANLNGKDNCSVKVMTTDGVQVGWLKNGRTLEDKDYRYDVFNRLKDGITVLSRVSHKNINANNNIIIQLEVARYSKR